MSKNTANSAFRKIDVDQYNEDNYREDDGGEANSPPIGPDDKEIANLLNQYPFANLLLLLVSLHIHVDNITLDCSLT